MLVLWGRLTCAVVAVRFLLCPTESVTDSIFRFQDSFCPISSNDFRYRGSYLRFFIHVNWILRTGIFHPFFFFCCLWDRICCSNLAVWNLKIGSLIFVSNYVKNWSNIIIVSKWKWTNKKKCNFKWILTKKIVYFLKKWKK